jgi:hypothetical protein
MESIRGQQDYGDMIVAIGEGTRSLEGRGYEREDGMQLYALTNIESYIEDEDEEAALQFLFPTGLTPQECKGTTILAATNESVDKWNKVVQAAIKPECNDYTYI